VTVHHPSSLLHQWSSVIRDLFITWFVDSLDERLVGRRPVHHHPSPTIIQHPSCRIHHHLRSSTIHVIRDRPSSIINSSPMVIRHP
jgi:hypothetical protein